MTESSGTTATGTIECDDGRTGTFAVSGNQRGGEGFGKMNNGDKIQIYYGNTVYVKSKD